MSKVKFYSIIYTVSIFNIHMWCTNVSNVGWFVLGELIGINQQQFSPFNTWHLELPRKRYIVYRQELTLSLPSFLYKD